MKLCRHQPHKVFTHILDPRYSTNDVLIDARRISDKIEHYVLQFKSPGAQKQYKWFYLSGKTIRKSPTQKNGAGTMYVVPMYKREEFTPIKDCNCEQVEFSLEY